MYQFFIETSQIAEDQIRILGKDVNHMKNVLRMKPGEEIRVTVKRPEATAVRWQSCMRKR